MVVYFQVSNNTREQEGTRFSGQRKQRNRTWDSPIEEFSVVQWPEQQQKTRRTVVVKFSRRRLYNPLFLPMPLSLVVSLSLSPFLSFDLFLSGVQERTGGGGGLAAAASSRVLLFGAVSSRGSVGRVFPVAYVHTHTQRCLLHPLLSHTWQKQPLYSKPQRNGFQNLINSAPHPYII